MPSLKRSWGSAPASGKQKQPCPVSSRLKRCKEVACSRARFCAAAFEAVLCHSMLETLDDPANVVAELGRVTKRGGVVGAASVDYGGLILAGEQNPHRFYEIRQQLWRAAGI